MIFRVHYDPDLTNCATGAQNSPIKVTYLTVAGPNQRESNTYIQNTFFSANKDAYFYMGSGKRFAQEPSSVDSGSNVRGVIHGVKLATIDASTTELATTAVVTNAFVNRNGLYAFVDFNTGLALSLLPTTHTKVNDFSLLVTPTAEACSGKLVLNSTTSFVDGYTYPSYWWSNPTSSSETMPLTYIFEDTSGSCPLTSC